MHILVLFEASAIAVSFTLQLVEDAVRRRSTNERHERHAPASPGRFSGDLDTYPIRAPDYLDPSHHHGDQGRAELPCARERHERSAAGGRNPSLQPAGLLLPEEDFLLYDDTLEGLEGQLTLSDPAPLSAVQRQVGISNAAAGGDHPNQVRGHYAQPQGSIPGGPINWLPPHPQTPWWLRQDETLGQAGLPGAPLSHGEYPDPDPDLGELSPSAHQHQGDFQASQLHSSDQWNTGESVEPADKPEEDEDEEEYPADKVWSRPAGGGPGNDTELEEGGGEGSGNGNAERRDGPEHGNNPQQRNRNQVNRRRKSPDGEVAPQKEDKGKGADRSEGRLARTKHRRRSQQSHKGRSKRLRRTTKNLESTTTNIVENSRSLHDSSERSNEVERSSQHHGSPHRSSDRHHHPSGQSGPASREGTLTGQGARVGMNDTGGNVDDNQSHHRPHGDSHRHDHDREGVEGTQVDSERHDELGPESSTAPVHTPGASLPPPPSTLTSPRPSSTRASPPPPSTLTSPQPPSTQPSPSNPAPHLPRHSPSTPAAPPTRPSHQIPQSTASESAVAAPAAADRSPAHRQGPQGGGHRPASRPLPSLERQPPKASLNSSIVAVSLLFAAMGRAGGQDCAHADHYYSSPRVWMDRVSVAFLS